MYSVLDGSVSHGFSRITHATPAEIATETPADRLIPPPRDRWVRCITVKAPVNIVYRWLCQLTVAPYSFDIIDQPGRRSPRSLTPGSEKLSVGQPFMIFSIISFEENVHITGLSRQVFRGIYGLISVTYAVHPLPDGTTRLQGNACVAHHGRVFGRPRRWLLALGDKVMGGRQLHILKRLAEDSVQQEMNRTINNSSTYSKETK